MGKGSFRRPTEVSEEEIARRWAKTFGSATSVKKITGFPALAHCDTHQRTLPCLPCKMAGNPDE